MRSVEKYQVRGTQKEMVHRGETDEAGTVRTQTTLITYEGADDGREQNHGEFALENTKIYLTPC